MRALLATLLLLASPALALEPPPLFQYPHYGIVELAGCSTVPETFEIHSCVGPEAFSNSPLMNFPPASWDGETFLSILRGPCNLSDSDFETCGLSNCAQTPPEDCNRLRGYTLAPWTDDHPALDTGGEPCFHGRGVEARPVVCDQVVSVETWAWCAPGVIDCSFPEPHWKSAAIVPTPDADVNRDNVVGVPDWLLIAQHFTQPAASCPTCDTNGDGVIGASDILAVAHHFGRPLESYTIIGHTQRYYSDHLRDCAPGTTYCPCPDGVVCNPVQGDAHVWFEPFTP